MELRCSCNKTERKEILTGKKGVSNNFGGYSSFSASIKLSKFSFVEATLKCLDWEWVPVHVGMHSAFLPSNNHTPLQTLFPSHCLPPGSTRARATPIQYRLGASRDISIIPELQ